MFITRKKKDLEITLLPTFFELNMPNSKSKWSKKHNLKRFCGCGSLIIWRQKQTRNSKKRGLTGDGRISDGMRPAGFESEMSSIRTLNAFNFEWRQINTMRWARHGLAARPLLSGSPWPSRCPPKSLEKSDLPSEFQELAFGANARSSRKPREPFWD